MAITKDNVRTVVDKGINASKVALTNAGTAIQNFGDRSVLRIERAQYESKLKHDITELGNLVYKRFVDEGQESIETTDEEIIALITNLKNYKAEIAQRDEILKAK